MNKKVGEYLLKDKLGVGQYGTVYQATRNGTDDAFAVKVIPAAKYRSTPRLDQFTNNEVGVLGKLDCPHVIRFIEIFRSCSNYYIVYEYCNGGTLAELLERRGHLPESEAVEMFRQLLEAFRVLFRENILHRDLKPANLLFHNGMVKIADFGFCKELLEPGQMTNTLVGSPMYMAPEVLRGKKYDARADVWSLGIVLYEMLFGKPPHEESTVSKLLQQVEKFELKMPLHVNSISAPIQTLLKRLLQTEPDKRISPKELTEHPLLSMRMVMSQEIVLEIRRYHSPQANVRRVLSPDEQERLRRQRQQEALLRFHRNNLQQMLQTLSVLLSELNEDNDSLLTGYLFYKLVYCYLSDLLPDSMYWQAVRIKERLPQAWTQSVQEEADQLQAIGDSLKACVLKFARVLSRRAKIQLNTHYFNVGYYLQLALAMVDRQQLQIKLLTCLLMYKHMFDVMEMGRGGLTHGFYTKLTEGLPTEMEALLLRCRQFVVQSQQRAT